MGDISSMPGKRRFALVVARFDWPREAAEGVRERCLAGVHFDYVRAVRCKGVPREQPETLLSLLTVAFEPGEQAPHGTLRLNFAGGATIALDVECIEAQLADLGPRWPVSSCPSHT